MASGSSSGTATQQDSDEDETKLKSNPSVLWDPLSPSDWDQQKPSSEAVVRIKRLIIYNFVCVCACDVCIYTHIILTV